MMKQSIDKKSANFVDLPVYVWEFCGILFVMEMEMEKYTTETSVTGRE